MGRYSETEPLYKRWLSIREKTFGKYHIDVAFALNNLGVLFWKQARYSGS